MIKQLDIDGVPVLLAPTTGPTHAGLGFRVGFADEPLARRGITHLVEHLALHSVGVTDYHYNGATGVEYTFFHMQGAEADVVAFLNGVCAALRDLPMQRLAVEKELLQAEANSRNPGVAEPMGLWRHGSCDYGTASYPEWGLPVLTADDLRSWVARYFTRENAVLWVAGDRLPDGLKLDLPSGVRQPLPEPSSALPSTPAYFTGSAGAVVWDAVVPRDSASWIFAAVLERIMFRELRQETGLSYTVRTDLQPIGRDRALITAVADSLPEKQGAVLGALVDVLAALRIGRLDPADVSAVINQRAEALQRAEEVGARLPGQALGLLAGRAVQDAEQSLAEVRAVTAGEVCRVASAAWETGLLMAPESEAGHLGFAAAPTRSGAAVTGRTHQSLDEPDARLVVGAEGVSLVSGDQTATVRFADCTIVRAWPDGARQFVGRDGIVVGIEPTLFADASWAIPWLDEQVRPELRIEQPPRGADRIPQPRPRPAARPNKPRVIVDLVFWVLVAVLSGGATIASGIWLRTDSTDPDSWVGSVVLFGAVAVFAAFLARHSLRKLKRLR